MFPHGRLDRSRPLWEMWFLTGLPDGRVGLFMKLHHAIADGVAEIAALGAFVDPIPDPPRTSAPPWTSLNQRVGWHRRLALVRSDLDLVKRVAHAQDATVNDVLMVALAGGLRALLLGRGERVDGLVLRAAVPVSLHQEHPGPARGNRDGMMVVPLPIGEPDDTSRLRLIAAETTNRKQKHRPAGGTLFRTVHRDDPAGLNAEVAFRIASVTKMMTATALLVLADQGRCQLDDPTGRYLPSDIVDRFHDRTGRAYGAAITSDSCWTTPADYRTSFPSRRSWTRCDTAAAGAGSRRWISSTWRRPASRRPRRQGRPAPTATPASCWPGSSSRRSPAGRCRRRTASWCWTRPAWLTCGWRAAVRHLAVATSLPMTSTGVTSSGRRNWTPSSPVR